MNVLSLCDGISCGQVALRRAGISIDKYFASEIKEHAIKCTQNNYPNTIQIGDVRKVSYRDGVLRTENGDFEVNIDIVIFGSPCQTFSIATKKEKRVGLADKEKSGLFFECYRVLKEVNPKWFLVENVASMSKEDKNTLSRYLGIEPIRINSEKVAPAKRDRLYWTNIPIFEIEEKNIKLQDVLERGYTPKEKVFCLRVFDKNPNATPVKMFHRWYHKSFGNLVFKNEQHFIDCKKYYDEHYKGMSAKDIPIDETNIFDGVRFITPLEAERCQTLPDGYTDCLLVRDALDVLGDGWTIDVVAHIFKGLR
jgi:site-specific DNA-cytosine methylase